MANGRTEASTIESGDRGISRRRFVRQVSLGTGALGTALYLPGALLSGPGPIEGLRLGGR